MTSFPLTARNTWNNSKYRKKQTDFCFTNFINEMFKKVSLREHMNRAKPEDKIAEVVDDMLDAVAGADPLV